MKVLTHEGVIVTLPFTTNTSGGSEFERLDGKGTVTVGIVTEVERGDVSRAVLRASQLDQAFATRREIGNDLKFIARRLSDIADGAEIRRETKGGKTRLVIPDSARPVRDEIKEGDRVAINSHVSPKTLMNARGTVQRVTGDQATVHLDEGDRKRVAAATGKDIPTSIQAPTAILDKLPDEK